MNNLNKLENEQLFKVYTFVELAYEKQFKNVVDKKENLYPIGWYEKDNYKKKIEILFEAMKLNILIENTLGYKNFVEGVVFVKKNQ